MFRKLSPPVINMGGLISFERAHRVSAPEFIEQLVAAGTDQPDAPLSPDNLSLLIAMIGHCVGGSRGSNRKASRLLKRAPSLVAVALREFLEDPLPTDRNDETGSAANVAELPSVLDMRSAWLAAGGEPAVFDELTLWEHTRILRQQEKRQRAALADAAVAARVSQSKDEQFRRFISEMMGDGRAKTPRDWVQHLFAATAHLPKVTQQELSVMKGRA